MPRVCFAAVPLASATPGIENVMQFGCTLMQIPIVEPADEKTCRAPSLVSAGLEIDSAMQLFGFGRES